MAARANVVLNDGQATPASHTFNPNSGDGNVPGVSIIEYEDRSGGISVGFPKISVQTRRANRNSRNTKIVMKVAVPVLETVSNSTVSGIAPAPTVAYTDLFTGEFILPERSSVESRKDLLAFVKNLFANGLTTSAIVDLESPW